MSITPPPPHSSRRKGFSLVEMMVSIAVLAMLLVLVLQMLEQMQRTWKTTRHNVTEFKSARSGFEEMSRRLSQATLNSYWGYKYGTLSRNGVSVRYGQAVIPESELHFVSGPANILFGSEKPRNGASRTTHAVFFQAPFGICFDADKKDSTRLEFEQLNRLLNAWGYLVEFNTDALDRPRFLSQLNNAPTIRPRYRLMEFRQPTEYLQVYRTNKGEGLRDLNTQTRGDYYKWFTDGLFGVNSEYNAVADAPEGKSFFRTLRPVAENIIGMILQPRESAVEESKQQKVALAPEYLYDSRRWQWSRNTTLPISKKSRHQVPPILDVTFIAVDDASFSNFASRKGIKESADDPKLIEDTLFVRAENYDLDMLALQTKLDKEKLDYRVFTSSIRMRESKWTSD